MKTFKAIALLGALFLCVASVQAAKPPVTDKVWVVVKPVQCLGNPWEKEWLGKHQNQGTKYPKKKEFDLVRSYFKRKGVPILQLRVKPYVRGEPLCPACDCPRGDTIYLMIAADDVPTIVDLGYTERLPVSDLPNKK